MVAALSRSGLLALVVSGALAPGAAAQGPPCPLATLAAPQIEGVRQTVVVGQPQPCPPRGGRREDFAVTLDFGDGTQALTTFGASDELWFIRGDHAYRRAGSYAVVGTVTNRKTGHAEVYRRTIDIPNAPLTARRTARPAFLAGKRSRAVVARFADGNLLAEPGDHRATIAWGDGSRSRGSVVRRDDGTFSVRGRHRYRSAPRRRIRVTVSDDRGATLRHRTRPVVR